MGVSSSASTGRSSPRHISAYCAWKAALVSLIRTVGGITANVILLEPWTLLLTAQIFLPRIIQSGSRPPRWLAWRSGWLPKKRDN
jgi:NAD(P)-dependent dehydrogenase (short-subunit alcohol dehydrogenase family)